MTTQINHVTTGRLCVAIVHGQNWLCSRCSCLCFCVLQRRVGINADILICHWATINHQPVVMFKFHIVGVAIWDTVWSINVSTSQDGSRYLNHPWPLRSHSSWFPRKTIHGLCLSSPPAGPKNSRIQASEVSPQASPTPVQSPKTRLESPPKSDLERGKDRRCGSTSSHQHEPSHPHSGWTFACSHTPLEKANHSWQGQLRYWYFERGLPQE